MNTQQQQMIPHSTWQRDAGRIPAVQTQFATSASPVTPMVTPAAWKAEVQAFRLQQTR